MKFQQKFQFCGDNVYYKCEALHYLCRPAELENVSAFDFYSKYEIVKFNSKTCMQFKNSESFRHPSFCESNNSFREGVRPRKTTKLIKIYQYDFPDSAMFEGNILDPETEVNEHMEKYSLKVLLLFLPYREKSDILPTELYTTRLRQCILLGSIKESAFIFLQNLHDTKSNNLRNMSSNDDYSVIQSYLQQRQPLIFLKKMIHQKQMIQSCYTSTT
jgi:hypothetical protein